MMSLVLWFQMSCSGQWTLSVAQLANRRASQTLWVSPLPLTPSSPAATAMVTPTSSRYEQSNKRYFCSMDCLTVVFVTAKCLNWVSLLDTNRGIMTPTTVKHTTLTDNTLCNIAAAAYVLFCNRINSCTIATRF